MLSYTSNYNYPVIVGDILITNSNKDNNLSIPSHLDGLKNLLQESDQLGTPSDLRQKTYIINDRLCIALGGRLDQMYSFLNSISTNFKNKLISDSELDEFLNDYPDDKLDHLAALILLIEINENTLHLNTKTWGNWKKEKHKEFENIFTIGTGATDYYKTAKQYNGGTGFTNDFNKSIAQNLDLLSKFLVFEPITAETILNKWGAGFEIIYFLNGQFKKLDDFTFVLFTGTFDSKSELNCFPIAVYKYKYHNDLLLIRAADNNKGKLFIVNPINKDSIDPLIEIPTPIYNSKHFILAYLIRLPNNTLYAPTLVLLVDQGNINIQEDIKNLHITVKSWIVERITDEIKKIIKQ